MSNPVPEYSEGNRKRLPKVVKGVLRAEPKNAMYFKTLFGPRTWWGGFISRIGIFRS